MNRPSQPHRPDPAVVEAGGETLRVRRYGPRERRLMMLHGGPGLDHQTLLPLADLLTGSYQVWLPDLPGHGASLRPDERLPGADALRRRISSWLGGLEAEGTPPHVLCGHSLGAWLARDLVRLGAVRPDALILLSPPSRPAGGEPAPPEAAYDRAREEWLRYLQIEVPGPMSTEFRRAARETRIIPPSRYRRLLKTLHRVFLAPPVSFRPDCPVLVLAGAMDRTTTPDQAEEIARLTGGAELRLMPGCGHFLWAEDAGPAASAILDFLNRNVGVSKRN